MRFTSIDIEAPAKLPVALSRFKKRNKTYWPVYNLSRANGPPMMAKASAADKEVIGGKQI